MNGKTKAAAMIAMTLVVAGMTALAWAYAGPRTVRTEPPQEQEHDHEASEDSHAADGLDDHAEPDPHDGHGHEAEDEDEVADEHTGHDHGQEPAVRLTPEDREAYGIELAIAGADALTTSIRLPAEIVLNADRVAHITPRAPGIVREVLVSVGDEVKAGQVMARLESVELGEAKIDFLAKWAEVGCCTIDLTRAQEVHDNTAKFLEALDRSPTLETLRAMNGGSMGEYRSELVSAYAEFVFAAAAHQREKTLLEKKVASQSGFQAAEAALKKADALYIAKRDSIAFSIKRDLLEAKREQQLREMELRGAERRLSLLGLSSEDIRELEQAAPQNPGTAAVPHQCDDPNCKNCKLKPAAAPKPAVVDLCQIEEDLARYPLRAPFDGTVINKHLTLGEKHGDDSTAFTIADLHTVWVDINVYQKDLPHVRKGQAVRIVPPQNAEAVDGVISFVAPIINPDTRTAVARVVLPNPDGRWRPGLFVTAELAIAERKAAVVIPKDAVQRIGEKRVVFVDDGTKLVAQPVSVGPSDPQRVEILAGLEPGQRYVAKGAFELKAKIVTSGLGAHAGHGH